MDSVQSRHFHPPGSHVHWGPFDIDDSRQEPELGSDRRHEILLGSKLWARAMGGYDAL